MKIQMTLAEAESFLKQHPSRPDGVAGSQWDVAQQVVADHETQLKDEAEIAAFHALPFYKRWWYIIVGTVLNFARTPVWWKIERWHVAVAVLVIALFLWGRAGVKNFSITRAAEPPVAEAPIGDPSLLQPSGGAQDHGDNNPILPLSPLATPNLVVDCIAATCPDAKPYLVNYQGKSGPAGSATLRAKCEKGATILGEIPKDTIVWVITSSISQGTYCENGECRRGMIKPVSSLPFTWNSGCVSFTALQPKP